MNHLGLFEGIGGFSLAAAWMGWKTIAWVEKDKFCQKVLKKNFPYAKGHGDIFDFDGTEYRGKIDILTGGFPCQPFSVAGKREGENDDRFLWPQMLRVIREIQPTFIIGENVGGILSMENGKTFESICTSLESEGYKVQTFNIPACAIEAPHKRSRVWIVAENTNSSANGRKETERGSGVNGNTCTTNEIQFTTNAIGKRCNNRSNNREERPIQSIEVGSIEKDKPERNEFQYRFSKYNEVFAEADSIRPPRQRKHRGQLYKEQNKEREEHRVVNANQFQRKWYEVATEFCRMDDGIPQRLDKHRKQRLKALGNAIVPQIAFELYKAIEEVYIKI